MIKISTQSSKLQNFAENFMQPLSRTANKVTSTISFGKKSALLLFRRNNTKTILITSSKVCNIFIRQLIPIRQPPKKSSDRYKLRIKIKNLVLKD